MNWRWSNVKLKSQMMIKFYDFTIHGKLIKEGIQWNQNKKNLDLRSGRNPCFKISKNPHPKFGQKWRKIRFLKWNWLTKSNIYYNYYKMGDWFSLLTRLTRRLGSKSRQLKCIWLVSSSTYVRCSMGEFDQILQRFVINPALIGLQSSLEHEGIMRNSEFCSKLLNFFTIQSRVA